MFLCRYSTFTLQLITMNSLNAARLYHALKYFLFVIQIFDPGDDCSEMKNEYADNRLSPEKGSGVLLKDSVCQVSSL